MATAWVSFLPLPSGHVGCLQTGHLLSSGFLVRVGHCRPRCTTASTKPLSFMHHPGWSWTGTRSIFLQLLLPWRCFCPFPAFLGGQMHCFSHLFWDPSRLQWDQQRGARDAPAGKVEMSSCPRRWMRWQTGFQDPGDLAWEHICVKVMARGCSGLPCVAGSPHPESSKRHGALLTLSSEWVLFSPPLFSPLGLKKTPQQITPTHPTNPEPRDNYVSPQTRADAQS